MSFVLCCDRDSSGYPAGQRRSEAEPLTEEYKRIARPERLLPHRRGNRPNYLYYLNNWRSENVFEIQIGIICGVCESKAGQESLPHCFDDRDLNGNVTVDNLLCRIFGFGIFRAAFSELFSKVTFAVAMQFRFFLVDTQNIRNIIIVNHILYQWHHRSEHQIKDE